MTIIIKGETFSIEDAEAIVSADEMLSKLLEEHAAQRIKEAQEQNKKVFGGENLNYTITVNNSKVYQGKDHLPPPGFISRILSKDTKKALNRTITVFIDFAFGINDKTKKKVLKRVLNTVLSHTGQLFFEVAGLYDTDASKALRSAHFVFKHTIGEPPADEAEEEENVLRWIANELVSRSPVISGTYRDNHLLFIDQRPFCTADELLSGSITEIPVAENEYSFSNPVPYSRKIEVGLTKEGRSFVINGDDHIYENTALDADSLFSDIAHITFEWRGNVNGLQINQSLSARHTFPKRAAGGLIESRVNQSNRGLHNKSQNRFPTIVVRF